ncbi:phosphatase PAP2 family protein [Sulfurimonas sp. HSL-1656]|uniref:phosphatase PAP2 family protein n=1 Tax=Thiomicrolovo subterrani TaxID=3131934 RepID=UPI0031F770B9
MKYTYARTVIPILFAIFLFSGCATKSGNWGSDATLLPGWKAVGHAAAEAALDPLTWAPLGAALCFQVENFDRRVSEWAVDQTPVFGSTENASDVSDTLKEASKINYYVTGVTVPTQEGWRGLGDRALGLGVGWVAMTSTAKVTDWMKAGFARERPDKSDKRSLPSGHTSGASVAATLAAQNIGHMPIPRGLQLAWMGAAYGVAGLTGWARVEAGVHYPSDVLTGFALGHFIGRFFNDAFITPAYRDKVAVSVDALSRSDMALSLHYRW